MTSKMFKELKSSLKRGYMPEESLDVGVNPEKLKVLVQSDYVPRVRADTYVQTVMFLCNKLDVLNARVEKLVEEYEELKRGRS